MACLASRRNTDCILLDHDDGFCDCQRAETRVLSEPHTLMDILSVYNISLLFAALGSVPANHIYIVSIHSLNCAHSL